MLPGCPRDMIADSGEALPNRSLKPDTNRAHWGENGSETPEAACYDFVRAFQFTTSTKEIRHAGADQPPSPCPS